MGAFADLFSRSSPERSPTRAPLSTLDIPLPPPQPLWALATEPDLAARDRRHCHGPRAPFNVYEGATTKAGGDGRAAQTLRDQRVKQVGSSWDAACEARRSQPRSCDAGMADLSISERGELHDVRSHHCPSEPRRPAPANSPPTARTDSSNATAHDAQGHQPPPPFLARQSASAPAFVPATPAVASTANSSARPPLPSPPSHASSASATPSRPPLPPSTNSAPLIPMHQAVLAHRAAAAAAREAAQAHDLQPPLPPPPPYHAPSVSILPSPPVPPALPERTVSKVASPRRAPGPPYVPSPARPAHSSAPPLPLRAPAASARALPAALSPYQPPASPLSSPRSRKTSAEPQAEVTSPRRRRPPRSKPPPLELSSSSGSEYNYHNDGFSLSDSDDTLPSPSIAFRSFSAPASASTSRPSPSPREGPKQPTPRSRRSPPHSPNPPAPRAPRVSPFPTPSPSPSKRRADAKQCSGITAQSRRCTRLVSSLHSQALNEEGDEGEEGHVPAYCAQHAKSALVESGCFVSCVLERAAEGAAAAEEGRERVVRREERWIRFEDWIPMELPLETQALLRHYMAEPVSERDTSGYIYIHELVPRDTPSHLASASTASPSPRALIKLGRALRPVHRLSQWRASCPSREPIVRDILPRTPSPSVAAVGAMRGVELRFAERGTRNHHRWERLCLVELAGRTGAAKAGGAKERCADCGKKHVECFWVERGAVSGCGGAGEAGEAGEVEWSVREVVERWERWCRDVLG